MYRAYDMITDWAGPVRPSVEAAIDDVAARLARLGGGLVVVVTPNPLAPDRCVGLDGLPVWPPAGRSWGRARWAAGGES